ncbi:MAG: cytochrome c biogenesis protein CcdA [Chloroflexi bacterium]|nr:cytochrome c biogenesis protein CcdA [Chloroflexota bacterium]
MTDISYWTAFGAGLLSFFSPCVLPLVPAYLANLAGTSAIELNEKRRVLPVFLHSVAFVAGFSILFILMGASAGLIGSAITTYAEALRIISGILIILFGIFLIAAFKIPWLNYEKRMHLQSARNPGYIRSVLIGGAFALGWTPCIGPILGSILFIASYTQETMKGAVLLATYSLGMGIPFLILGLAWGYIIPFWRGINRHLGLISILSGILLIIVGILMLTGQLTWLSRFAT